MKIRKISITSILIVIVLCVAALFKTSVDQYEEQNSLRSTSVQLAANSKQISRLDTISMSLNEAENDYRIYTTTWNKDYLDKYNAGIRNISVLLQKFSTENQIRNASESINIDLKKKKQQLILYLQIKKLTDSLMFLHPEIDSIQVAAVPIIDLPIPDRIVTETVRVEEVVIREPGKKKKFFQRLKSAILNKVPPADSAKTRKIETTVHNSESMPIPDDKKKVEKIERYYKNLFEKQQHNHLLLNDQEQTILMLNEKILHNIQVIFKKFSNREHEIVESRKIDLKNRSLEAINAIDRSGKIHLVINMICLTIVVFLLIKLYNAYLSILDGKKAAEEQVIVKSRFFTSLSHEMRTPLNAIIGVNEQLKSTPLNEQQEMMSKLLDNSSSMLLAAVNEVLDFSRLETGKLTLSNVPFDYKLISREIISTTTVLAQQKDLVLHLNQDHNPDLLLMGDPYRLRQIIMNLVANAIKFCDCGEVTVNIEIKMQEANQVLLMIQVIDTGIGIAATDLPSIFDEFAQVIHPKRIDWQKGSGLGLPICKKLVELHQGKITASSEVGKGTTFSLEIPYEIAAHDAEIDMKKKAIPLQTPIFKKLHLLIVDDAEMNLMVLKMIFDKHGISYDTATNGKEALEAFNNKPYDMILTDIEMPVMNGTELTRMVRSHEDRKKAAVPVIAITGQVSQAAHNSYLLSGLNSYLIKPYSETELLEKILDYLPPPSKL